jgi:hypothetical protein
MHHLITFLAVYGVLLTHESGRFCVLLFRVLAVLTVNMNAVPLFKSTSEGSYLEDPCINW